MMLRLWRKADPTAMSLAVPVVGPHFSRPTVQVGAGGDKVWSKGFGIGVEGGYVGTGGAGSGAGFAQRRHRESLRIDSRFDSL